MIQNKKKMMKRKYDQMKITQNLIKQVQKFNNLFNFLIKLRVLFKIIIGEINDRKQENIISVHSSPRPFQQVISNFNQESQRKKEQDYSEKAIQIQKNWKGYKQRKNYQIRKTGFTINQENSLQQQPVQINSQDSLTFIELAFPQLSTCKFDEMEPLENFSIKDFAVYQYRDGSIYAGEIVNCMRNGKGRYCYKNGSIYEGDWKMNQLQGYGRFLHQNGDFYEGNFYEGRLILQKKQWKFLLRRMEIGTEIWADGAKYDGVKNMEEVYLFGLKDHIMQEILLIIVWTVLENMFNQMYIGQFKEDMMHGEGEFSWPNGKKYSGWYFKNQKCGLGTFEWPDGRRYVGFLCNGLMNGGGVIFELKGKQIQGEWIYGILQK
ncbi:unnamed protein product [Paramecium sonneborni]|uniref:MORN repeat protein n=1 Tax=Paramecium sonneborni TaxID=65129 RepID=A0A8S1RT75_9CILI|nr:unnamed protein product [Paramecium sonneborni]